MKNNKNIIVEKTANLLENNFYTKEGVYKTPMLYSPALSNLCSGNVYIKCENLQTTGSFKIRGASSALLNLPQELKNTGVLTAAQVTMGLVLQRRQKH
nr:pyridoxal-phosphate dependent enzyme [Photobacterium sanguinicancri]